MAAALSALTFSCGAPPESPAPGSTTDGYSVLQISSARWTDGPEPRVVVNGEWGIGITSPPSCDLLEGGESGGWRNPEGGMQLDGGRFRLEFIENPASESSSVSNRDGEFQVRCQVNQSTGRVVEASAPVEGTPAPS